LNLDGVSNQVFVVALNEAKLKAHEFVTPEHFLYAALMFAQGRDIVANGGGDVDAIRTDLDDFFDGNVPKCDSDSPIQSFMLIKLFESAMLHVASGGKDSVTLGDIIAAMFGLNESYATYILEKNGATRLNVLKFISHRAGDNAARDPSLAADAGLLQKFTVNLSEKAANGELDPFVGRAEILGRTIRTLCRRQKNNPIHVGDPGVGKTAVVEGLARMIADGGVPAPLAGATVYRIDMSSVVAGTRYRGDFEERLISVLDALMKTAKPIVYLDEIHSIVGAGAVSGGAIDAAGILKPYLAGGDIRFIGSTTHEDYKKYIEKNRALGRRFQMIDVPEPDADECFSILCGLRERYESHHNVRYPDEVLRAIISLSEKYVRDRYLPDKAIDIMDEIGASIRMSDENGVTRVVTVKDVERCVADTARVPEESVGASEAERLKNLPGDLKKEIFGQNHAVETVADAIKFSRLGLSEREKPVASMLFVGPTGVGKTEIARRLAALMNVKLLRYDMSEYQERHSVARLIGSPPGYVGYEEGGLLTDAVRKDPYCVLLLDEVEKAHQDIMNVLLQIMDYGTLTDNAGKKADFKNAVIIMTSNAGAREIGRRMIGYDAKSVDSDAVDREVERIFSPEFRNRLDATVVFNHLSIETARLIVRKNILILSKLLEKKGVAVSVTDDAVEHIAAKGLSEKYGAREIIRIIDKEIKKKIADALLTDDLKAAKVITIGAAGGELAFETEY